MKNFSEAEIRVISNVFEFCIKNWDWESPSLFGLSKSNFQKVKSELLHSFSQNGIDIMQIITDAFGQFLYGALTYKKNEFLRYIGLNLNEAEILLEKIIQEKGESFENS